VGRLSYLRAVDSEMRIGIITPAPPGSRYGNRITALRWARILRELGHHVSISQQYKGESFDLLIALHARRSHKSINHFHHEHPDLPLIVALSGTDLYRDLRIEHKAQESIEMATRVVTLQPKAAEEIRPELRDKVRVIHQSVNGKSIRIGLTRSRKSAKVATRTFDICVIGHLRPVKDPFRAARAARLLPSSSRIRILHIGSAMTKEMEDRARAEMRVNPRYRWIGEQPQWRAHRMLSRSDLCILSSRLEGGANVLSEAITASVPVLASRIAGTIGILGEDYPGYFGVGNTGELARLMIRAETESHFLKELTDWCERLAPRFVPERERAAWADLLCALNKNEVTR
jgi:putative glycosyltransferase (TIGR04348 family)